jgi:hypothetical protein
MHFCRLTNALRVTPATNSGRAPPAWRFRSCKLTRWLRYGTGLAENQRSHAAPAFGASADRDKAGKVHCEDVGSIAI